MDVVHYLFGDISLTVMANGIEREIDDLLWRLKGPLGHLEYLRLRGTSKPAVELIKTIWDRRSDNRLTDAFRDYVLASEGLHFMLTPEAKHESTRRPEPNVDAGSNIAEG